MATTTGTQTVAPSGAVLYAWATVPNGNHGDGFDMSGFADASVQIEGTFSTGGTVSIEGSNDGTNWEILTDHTGAVMTYTAAGLKAPLQLPRFIRPDVTAGDGSTSLTITLVARANR